MDLVAKDPIIIGCCIFIILVAVAYHSWYKDKQCGITSNGVVSFCNTGKYVGTDYSIDGEYTGEKWQCVEFVRRYYIQLHRLTFPSISNAYGLPDIKTVRHLDSHLQYPCSFHMKDNGKPQPEDILVFRHNNTGHTAIVIEILPNRKLRIAEQNWSRLPWKNYSREVSVEDPSLLGWLHIDKERLF
jgi:glutathionylspermidine amidase/synthetase